MTSRSQRHISLSMLPEPAASELEAAGIPSELLAVAYVIFERGRLVGRSEVLPPSSFSANPTSDVALGSASHAVDHVHHTPPPPPAPTPEDTAKQQHRTVLGCAVDVFQQRNSREPTVDEMPQIDGAIKSSGKTQKYIDGVEVIPSERILISAVETALESTGLIPKDSPGAL